MIGAKFAVPCRTCEGETRVCGIVASETRDCEDCFGGEIEIEACDFEPRDIEHFRATDGAEFGRAQAALAARGETYDGERIVALADIDDTLAAQLEKSVEIARARKAVAA